MKKEDKEEKSEEELKEEKSEDAKEKETKKKNKIKIGLKKIHYFLWESESPWSYAAFIIVSFLILKFVAFPAFLYATGYSDVAAVVSGSMRHDVDQLYHNYDSWLEFHQFSEDEVSQWPYQEGLNIGDVIFVKEVPPEQIQIGDVILFRTSQGQIIHRVVGKEKIDDIFFFTTKGDANPAVSPVEKSIPQTVVKGKLVNKLPYLGYPKVAFSYLIPSF